MNFLEHVPNGNSAKKQWGRGGYPTLFTGRDFYFLSREANWITERDDKLILADQSIYNRGSGISNNRNFSLSLG